MRSPPFRPDDTIHWPPCAVSAVTGRGATLLSAPTTITLEPSGLRSTACCGTVMAASLTPCSRRARTYMPGSRTRFGFGNSARIETAPELSSTATSENSSLPACG